MAGTGKLDRIKSIAEGIGHIGDAPIFAQLDGAIERAAEREQPRHRGVEITDDEIEMNRRPVPLVAARHLSAAEVCDGGAIGEKEDGTLAPSSSIQVGLSRRFKVRPSPSQ
jgi:hypothetical protein